MKAKRIILAILLIAAIATAMAVYLGMAWGIAAVTILGGGIGITLLLAPTNDKNRVIQQSTTQKPQEDESQEEAPQEAPSSVHVEEDLGDAQAQPPSDPAKLETAEPISRDGAPELPEQNIMERQPDPQQSFSYETFCSELLHSNSPLEYLEQFCESTAESKTATPIERYLVKRLSEADIADWCEEDDSRSIDVILARHSHMFYIREVPRISYGRHLQLLMIEAALNAVQFAFDFYDDPLTVEEENLIRLEQRHISSICAQASDIDTSNWTYLAMPWQSGEGPSIRGEWSVRSALSESIETLRVPYRLEATFRCNVAGGDIAIEFFVTPAKAFPRSSFTDGLGIVPTTSHMRSRMASDYAARLAILLSNAAFQSSNRIRRVWIAAIKTTPSTRACLLWARIDRRAFSHLHMDSIREPLEHLSQLGAIMNVEAQVLQPTELGFYLEDDRFCPPMRHDLWKMSERSLPPSAALSMAAPRVSDLRIHEELLRKLAAEAAVSGMPKANDSQTTQKSVRSVFAAASMTSDIDVWCAAERVAKKLVDGTLSPSDPLSIEDEFVAGDSLSRAVLDAQRLLAKEQPEKALARLEAALRVIDDQGTYNDTDSVVYRSFDTFAQRVVYNRLNASDARYVILVPDAYISARLLASTILLVRVRALGHKNTEDAKRALHHAHQALKVAPLSTPATMCSVACNEAIGNIEEAADILRDTLEWAHEPQDIALAYYRMAFMQWHLDHHEACLACYQLAAYASPTFVPIVLAECHALAKYDPLLTTPMDTSEVEEVLRSRKIPLAPTQRMSYLLYDCAAASVDAEVFPVARDLLRILESFTGDDVIRGIRNSLEREPDA